MFYYFTTKVFKFHTKKLQELFGEMSAEDKILYDFDHSKIEWEKYYCNAFRETRRLLLKEDESTIEKGAKKMKKMFYADLTLKTFFMFILVALLWRI